MCIFQIIHHSLIASDSLKAPEFLAKVRHSNGMVENPVGPIVIGVGPTNNANERQVLTVRAGDGVEYTQSTDGERNNTRADATRARVSVSSVSSVELVAASDVGESRLGDEVVEEREVEIAGNGEHVGDTDLDQSTCQVATQCGLRRVDKGGGRDRVLDGGYGTV
jgi:hypothetical protein